MPLDGYLSMTRLASWGRLLRVPLDNCLVSQGVTVLERERGSDVGSDHFPLIIRFGSSEGSTEHSTLVSG